MNTSTSPADSKSVLSSPFAKEIQFGLMYGMEVNVSSFLTERVAYPRSSSRAKRRAAQGHPQHYAERPSRQVLKTPFGFVMHPAILEELKTDIARRAKLARDSLEMRALLGGPPSVERPDTGRQRWADPSPPTMQSLTELRDRLLPKHRFEDLWP